MKNAESTAKLEFFTALAKKFYLTMFEANKENTYKIDLSLNRDTTVMLLASKVGGKDLPKSTFHLRKTFMLYQLHRIVACVLMKQMMTLRPLDPDLQLRLQNLCLWMTLIKRPMSF
jgi:hypothetical protein